jgi:hypothetical protein
MQNLTVTGDRRQILLTVHTLSVSSAPMTAGLFMRLGKLTRRQVLNDGSHEAVG